MRLTGSDSQLVFSNHNPKIPARLFQKERGCPIRQQRNPGSWQAPRALGRPASRLRPLSAGWARTPDLPRREGQATRSPCWKWARPFLSTCPAAGGNPHLSFFFQPPKGPEGPRPGHHGGFRGHMAEPEVGLTVFGRRITSVFGTLSLGPEAMSFRT